MEKEWISGVCFFLFFVNEIPAKMDQSIFDCFVIMYRFLMMVHHQLFLIFNFSSKYNPNSKWFWWQSDSIEFGGIVKWIFSFNKINSRILNDNDEGQWGISIYKFEFFFPIFPLFFFTSFNSQSCYSQFMNEWMNVFFIAFVFFFHFLLMNIIEI